MLRYEAIEKRRSEHGYVLIAVIWFLAILVFSLSVSLPRVTQTIRRDREIETIHRGQEYIRAVQLYYRMFRSYPPSTDALLNTNQIRFLRKRYTDPLTGKDDWKPIILGQNHAPATMGFFGVPMGLPAASASRSSRDDAAEDPADSLDDAGHSSVGDSDKGYAEDPSEGDAVRASSPIDSYQGNLSLGSGGIIGFSPRGAMKSILVYKTKNHYNQWEFLYDPVTDPTLHGVIPVPLLLSPPTNTGSPGFNSGASTAIPGEPGPIDPNAPQ